MSIAHLSVGSNKGNKLNNIKKLIKYIQNEDAVRIISVSSIYETEPVGFKNQENFYNLCLKIESRLNPYALLKLVKNLEKKLGRKRSIKWGPRTIDVDILFYDDLIIEKKDLKIPHPKIQNRRFVLIPLKEIEPNLVCPDLKKSISDLLKETKNNSSIKKLNYKIEERGDI